MTRKIIDQQGNSTLPARAGDPRELDLAAVTDMAIAMGDSVPEAVSDDGAGIIGNLIGAGSWEDLNTISKLPNGKDMTGRRIIVQAIARRPSELQADDDATGVKLPYYLVVDAVDERTGESVRWQTSAPALVVPLIKLHGWGKFPALVEVRQSDKATARGFRPLNLFVHAVA